MRPSFVKVMLPINIMEAIYEDQRLGFRDNAKASWSLSLNHPERKAHTEKQAHWDDKKQNILVTMPDPRAWADFYQTWNMAFVSHYTNFPYLLTKLAIPAVADYSHEPEGYIYSRGVCLYTFIHWLWLDRADRRRSNEEDLNWADAAFTKSWGRVNLESSADYNRKAREYYSKP